MSASALTEKQRLANDIGTVAYAKGKFDSRLRDTFVALFKKGAYKSSSIFKTSLALALKRSKLAREPDSMQYFLSMGYAAGGNNTIAAYSMLSTAAIVAGVFSKHLRVSKGYGTGVVSKCFLNARDYAAKNPEYRVAVGFIVIKNTVASDVSYNYYAHAFCMDDKGSVFDPTNLSKRNAVYCPLYAYEKNTKLTVMEIAAKCHELTLSIVKGLELIVPDLPKLTGGK